MLPEPCWLEFFRQCRRVNRATCALVCRQWLVEMRRYPRMPLCQMEIDTCVVINSVSDLGLEPDQWKSMQVAKTNNGWSVVRQIGDLLTAPTDLLVRFNEHGPFSLPAGQQLPLIGLCMFYTIRVLPIVDGFVSDCALSMIWLPTWLRYPQAMTEYWQAHVLRHAPVAAAAT